MVSSVLSPPSVSRSELRAHSYDSDGARRLGRLLRQYGYTQDAVSRLTGQSWSPTLRASTRQLSATEPATPLNALVRLLFLGKAVSGSLLEDLFSHDEQNTLAPVLTFDHETLEFRAEVSIAVVSDLLVAADPIHHRFDPGYVPGISQVTLRLSRLMRTGPDQTFLDLGSGQGYLALRASATGARVTASDINPRAHQLLKLSQQLNDSAPIVCATGPDFQPLTDGQQFDTIVSNPGFVIGAPPLLHYSSGRSDDETALGLALSASEHLSRGGRLLMMMDWLDYAQQPFEVRLRERFEGVDCDVLAVPGFSVSPERYVELRLREYTTFLENSRLSESLYDGWLDSLRSRHVTRVYGGLLLVRQRKGRRWRRVEAVADLSHLEDSQSLADHCRSIDAMNIIDDRTLAMARPRLAEDVKTVLSVRRSSTSVVTVNELRRPQGLVRQVVINALTHRVVSILDGRLTINAALAKACAPDPPDPTELRATVTAVRSLMEFGFVVADPEATARPRPA